MVKVLDVTLFDENIPKAVDMVLAAWKQESRQNRLISATGVCSIITYLRLAKNDGFISAL